MNENDFLPEEKKYICANYDPVTQGYLRKFCEQQGFDLSYKWDGSRQDPEDFDFHTTIWFTTTEHRIKNDTYKCNFEVRPVNFELFGENENILVMEVQGDGLQEIRDSYGRAYDMQDMYPTYRPHITVCYNWTDGLPDFEPQEYLTEPLVVNSYDVKKQVSTDK